MSDTPHDTDDVSPADDEIDRRRLIRWIAVLAFSVPIVVEVVTFGNILGDELLGGGDGENAADATESGTATPTDRPGAVGVGEDLLPDAAPTATVQTSEIRERESGRTYVLGVDVANETESTIDLRLRTLELRDGSTVDGLSSTGPVEPGENGMVTAAWGIGADATPGAVAVELERDGETPTETVVPVERPETA